MAELEQELAAALAQGGAEAAQPKALPMAEEDDITE
jgi:DNA-directed RNA polymerase subunit omega